VVRDAGGGDPGGARQPGDRLPRLPLWPSRLLLHPPDACGRGDPAAGGLSILGGYTGLFINFTPNPWQFQFKGKVPYYFVALCFLGLASGAVWLIERSKFGAYLVAIREDEDAAEALGVDTFRYKMLAYAVSASLTALGGTFYAYYQFYLQPNTVLSMHHSVDIMIRPIVGGSGTILGPILGSFLLELLGEFSRTYFATGAAGLYVVIYGLLLIAVVLFLPRGVYPTFRGWVRRALGRRT
jgi:branched-chain amino acid transport system permease protein